MTSQNFLLRPAKQSLAQQLEVTIQDFLPKDGAHLVRLSTGWAVISTRLHGALGDYANTRRISLTEALERLRDELP
jgi:hypothetical protein